MFALFCSTPAWAAQRTFVSRSGADSNPCTTDQPCRSFAAAIAVTNPNGEVVAIDSAGYGPVTVTQGVTILAPLGVHAGVTVTAGDGITVNAAATDVVILRNLYLNAQGGFRGITLNSANALYIEHCTVSGFDVIGIDLRPSTDCMVAISDTAVRQSKGAGLRADSPGALLVFIDHCRFDWNRGGGVKVSSAVAGISNSSFDSNGIDQAYGPSEPGIGAYPGSNVAVDSSVVANTYIGIYVDGGQATVHNSSADHNTFGYFSRAGKLSLDTCMASGGDDALDVDTSGEASVTDCTFVDNVFAGITVVGGGIARIARTTISRNDIGIDFSGGGGTVRSAGDNVIAGNVTSDTNGMLVPATLK